MDAGIWGILQSPSRVELGYEKSRPRTKSWTAFGELLGLACGLTVCLPKGQH